MWGRRFGGPTSRFSCYWRPTTYYSSFQSLKQVLVVFVVIAVTDRFVPANVESSIDARHHLQLSNTMFVNPYLVIMAKRSSFERQA